MAVWGALATAAISYAMSPSGTDPSQAQQMVDPFAPYRQQYGQMLNQLIGDPTRVQSMAGYNAQLQAGTQAVERGLAARGQIGSGQEQIALQNLGSSQFNQYYNEQYNRLAQLSGASTSPAAGGQAGLNTALINQQRQSAFAGALASIIGPSVGSYSGNYLQGLFSSTPQGTSYGQGGTGMDLNQWLSSPSAGWQQPGR